MENYVIFDVENQKFLSLDGAGGYPIMTHDIRSADFYGTVEEAVESLYNNERFLDPSAKYITVANTEIKPVDSSKLKDAIKKKKLADFIGSLTDKSDRKILLDILKKEFEEVGDK